MSYSDTMYGVGAGSSDAGPYADALAAGWQYDPTTAGVPAIQNTAPDMGGYYDPATGNWIATGGIYMDQALGANQQGIDAALSSQQTQDQIAAVEAKRSNEAWGTVAPMAKDITVRYQELIDSGKSPAAAADQAAAEAATSAAGGIQTEQSSAGQGIDASSPAGLMGYQTNVG